MRSKFEGKDVDGALTGTVCRYQGVPVLVRAFDAKTVELYTLRDDSQLVTTVRHDDEELDISTPPLGYAQVRKNQVVYVTRVPLRRWKQGIHADNIKPSSLPNSQLQYRGVSVMTKIFEDMILGRYPPLLDCIQELIKIKEYGEKAISRDCALSINKGVINVFFKNDPVGIIPMKEALKPRPTVLVPNVSMGRIITLYLNEFTWEVV